MRIKANHLTLGLFHEAYFVCSSHDEYYFKEVATILERKYAVKTGMFVYDKDVLSASVMRGMRNSYNVLFMLNEGVSEAAAADPAHPFRKVYGYVNAKNTHSISLVSVNGCAVRYDIEYPQEMESYKWLHRKSFFIDRLTPEQTADEFYEEFRRNHMRSSKARLRKLSLEGRGGYIRMYECLFGGLWRLLIVELVAALAYYLGTLITNAEDQTLATDLQPLALLLYFGAIGLCATTFLWLAILIARYFRQRERVHDVSSVFADFKKTTMGRIAILSVPAMVYVFGYGSYQLLGMIEAAGFPTETALIAIWGTVVAFTVVHFVKAMVMRTMLASTRYYLEVSVLKIAADGICLAVDIFLIAVAYLSAVQFGIF